MVALSCSIVSLAAKLTHRVMSFLSMSRMSLLLISLSLYYMYTRDNGVPIGLFRQFRLDLRTCFDVLAVRSEVQTQG